MEGYQLVQCPKCGDKFPADRSTPEHGPDGIRRCPKCGYKVGQKKGGAFRLEPSVHPVSRH